MEFYDWTDTEVALIVADYFDMLKDELRGQPINKTCHRTALIPLLNNRSNGSVEFKHQNISAVLTEMGYPFIKGYKPRFNFQRTRLVNAVDNYIRTDKQIEPLFLEFSDAAFSGFLNRVEFSSWVVQPPDVKQESYKGIIDRRPIRINFLEREQANRNLGLQGENLVFEYEQLSLKNAGKESLADQVEWVSRDLGDGLGFDILSKNHNGTDKYIEVKTTKLGKEAPFYFSANEYDFSVAHERDFYLYRVFSFNNDPKLFKLQGRYDAFCHIKPQQFVGKFS